MLPESLSQSSMLPWELEFSPQLGEKGLPGISIVIPIFNSGRFLEKTIRSLLCNDLTGVELIVIDGKSNDNTQEILHYYKKYFSICISEEDRGQSDAINKGFSFATQPILYWLNGDDVILPHSLLHVRRAFKDNPGTEVVVGDAYMTEIDFTPIRHFTFSDENLAFSHLLNYAFNHLVQPSVFFTKNAWDNCGPVADDMHYAMDADLFLCMASRYNFYHLPVDVAYSVYHNECKTRNKRGESIIELSIVQAKYGGFEEAKNTLNILVELFNEAEKRALAAREKDMSSECQKCEVKDKMIKSIRDEVFANRKALLAMDMANA